MLKPSEFRIGNILMDELTGTFLKVDDIISNEKGEYNLGFYVIDRSKYPLPKGWKAVPVPITNEIIQRCGFDPTIDIATGEDEVNGYKIYQSATDRHFEFQIFLNKKKHCCAHYLQCALGKHPQYLHELQNVVHVLTGKEIEFKHDQ